MAHERIQTELDHTTGELLRTSTTFTKRVKTQPFVSIPLPMSDMLHAILNKDGRVLIALAELSEFNTNTVFLVASRRQQIMARAGVSSAQLSTSLKRLRAAGIVSGPKGEAAIHPVVLWKGETSAKLALLSARASATKSTFQPTEN
jgi:CRP-like cAMP-binding protein